jgi:hypothetical protein
LLGIVVYGTYYFRQSCVAFRNDYCRQCKGPRVALQYRAFEVGHMFWLPLLPKGFLRRWVCTKCGQDPHWVLTSNGVKWAGIVFLALLALSAWTTSPEPGKAVGYWVMRVGLLWGIYALWRGIQKSRSVAVQSSAVQPYAEPFCPSCRGPLASRARIRSCTRCGATQADLSPRAA